MQDVRFSYFMDPANTWLIWDRQTEAPAEWSGVDLVGLSETEAKTMCRLMNAAASRVSDRRRLAG